MDYQNNFKQYLNSRDQAPSESMTSKELQDLQEALNNSRDTARNEEERREFDRQAAEIQKHFYRNSIGSEDIVEDSVKEKPFTPKRWNKPPKSPIACKAQKEFEMTFQDLPEPSGKVLDVVYHKPVFDLPVTTNPEYRKYTVCQRARLLSRYFTKINGLRAKLAKGSFAKAPYPKPILPSNKCKNSLLKNGTDDGSFDDVDLLPVQDLYVSRAGRQVKRKIYTEETEGDSDPDFVYSNKKNKADDSDTKITLDTPFIAEENHNEKSAPKATKTKKEPTKRPPLGIKKYASRSEALFDKMSEDAEKKKQEQEQMDVFEKSLPRWDDDEDKWPPEDAPVKDNVIDDASLIRKRVPPPIPTKKTSRPRKTAKQEANDKNDAKTESPPGSPVLKRYANAVKNVDTKSKPRAKMQKAKDSASPEASASKLEKNTCPICNKEFLQSEIVNHASNCGEADPLGEPVTTNSGPKPIKCYLCDKEFAVDGGEYAVHVKLCVATKAADL